MSPRTHTKVGSWRQLRSYDRNTRLTTVSEPARPEGHATASIAPASDSQNMLAGPIWIASRSGIAAVPGLAVIATHSKMSDKPACDAVRNSVSNSRSNHERTLPRSDCTKMYSLRKRLSSIPLSKLMTGNSFGRSSHIRSPAWQPAPPHADRRLRAAQTRAIDAR